MIFFLLNIHLIQSFNIIWHFHLSVKELAGEIN